MFLRKKSIFLLFAFVNSCNFYSNQKTTLSSSQSNPTGYTGSYLEVPAASFWFNKDGFIVFFFNTPVTSFEILKDSEINLSNLQGEAGDCNLTVTTHDPTVLVSDIGSYPDPLPEPFLAYESLVRVTFNSFGDCDPELSGTNENNLIMTIFEQDVFLYNNTFVISSNNPVSHIFIPQ